MVPVTPQTHAWAYEDKDPQRFIAALELLGDIYYTEMIGHDHPGQAGTHLATATTDNQGNKYIINKHSTMKYPNMCLLMHLVDQLNKHDLYLRVEHKDRTHNEWADQLASQDSTGFDPAKRFKPTLHLDIFEQTKRMAREMGLHKPKDVKTHNHKQKIRDLAYTAKATGKQPGHWKQRPQPSEKTAGDKHNSINR